MLPWVCLAVFAGLAGLVAALVCLGCVALVLKLYTEILKIRELTKNGGLMSSRTSHVSDKGTQERGKVAAIELESNLFRAGRSQGEP